MSFFLQNEVYWFVSLYKFLNFEFIKACFTKSYSPTDMPPKWDNIEFNNAFWTLIVESSVSSAKKMSFVSMPVDPKRIDNRLLLS